MNRRKNLLRTAQDAQSSVYIFLPRIPQRISNKVFFALDTLVFDFHAFHTLCTCVTFDGLLNFFRLGKSFVYYYFFFLTLSSQFKFCIEFVVNPTFILRTGIVVVQFNRKPRIRKNVGNAG